ncbi:MAG: hypothetical protein KAX16_08105, partial [Actinomycetia bacterium]|nr:hypothetical protein [Actinomycetes bacterium]
MKKKWLLLMIVGLIVLVGCKETQKTENETGNNVESEKSSPEVKIDKDKGSIEYKDKDNEGRAEIGEDV